MTLYNKWETSQPLAINVCALSGTLQRGLTQAYTSPEWLKSLAATLALDKSAHGLSCSLFGELSNDRTSWGKEVAVLQGRHAPNLGVSESPTVPKGNDIIYNRACRSMFIEGLFVISQEQK